jgi:HSP20 family protein
MPLATRSPSTRRDDPFTALQREMNHLFEDMLRGVPRAAAPEAVRAAAWSPDVDIKETPGGYILTADLPGLDQKDVGLTLVGDTLTIKGERKVEKTEKDDAWQVMERTYGAFYRAFTLPFVVDAAKVQAAFDKGVLTITIPKPAEATAAERTIPIATPGSPARAA